MSIKPFDSGNWFPINNAVFDHIMKRLSPSAFKILCVAIRYTWGWVANGDKMNRRESDVITYRQFKEMSGIGSFSTIHSAIQECLDKQMLLRTEMPDLSQGAQKNPFTYRLNIDYEIAVATTETVAVATTETVAVATTETVAVATTETVAVATTETVASKQRNKQTKVADDDSSSQQIILALTEAGVDTVIAQQLAQTVSLKMVRGWLDYCKSNGHKLNDPIAFLVSRLRKGMEPPTVQSKKGSRDDRMRYVTGKYADIVQH